MISTVTCALSDLQSVEKEEMNGETCSCNGFSIRRYVAEVRQRDVEKCWPFHLQISKSRLKQGTTALLPSLEVIVFNYWKWLAYKENVIEFHERSEQQRNIFEGNTAIDGQDNALCRLENVVPCCIDNKQNPELEATSPFLLREDETDERGAEDETDESGAEDEKNEFGTEGETNESGAAHHLSRGIISEEILSENNVNNENPKLEVKTPCLLRKDETNEKGTEKETNGKGAEKKTNESGAEGETNESGAEVRTNESRAEDGINEKGAALHLLGGIKSVEILTEKTVNKQKPELEAKSPCLLRKDETNAMGAEVETDERVAEDETNEKGAAYYLSASIKPKEILSEISVDKQNLELEAKSPCILREDETNEKGATHHSSGGIKSEELFSENNANKQKPELEAKSPCLLREDKSNGKGVVHDISRAIKSTETLSENNVKIYRETEGRVTNYRLKQLTPDRTVLGANADPSYLGKESPTCSDIFCSAPTHNVERDQNFINNESDGLMSEFWRLNTIDKVEILQPALTRCSVERIDTRSQNNSTPLNYTEQVVNETLSTSQCRLTTRGSVQYFNIAQVMEEMGNNGAPPKLKESEYKRLREKRKQILREKRKRKKHLMGYAVTSPKRGKHCMMQRKSQLGPHIGSVQNNLVSGKSIPESFTSPFEQIVNHKTNTISAVQYTLNKRDNYIEWNKILNQQNLSNAATHNLRKVKVKRQCCCGTHLGSVHNDLAPQKSISESFTSPLEQIGNDKTNTSCAVQCMLEKRENYIEEKKISNEHRLSNAATHNVSKVKMKKRYHQGAHFDSAHNDLVPNKSIPESFTSPLEQIVDDKTNISSAVWYMPEKRENAIEQKKILNVQMLSNAGTHNIRNVKEKRKCDCGEHFVSVQNYLIPKKSISDSFTNPFEQNDKTDNGSTVQCMLEKRETEIEQKKILNGQGMPNAATHNLGKLKMKKKCYCGAHLGFVQNNLVPERSISESFTSPIEQIMTDKTNNSSAFQYTLENRENDIEQENILNQETLSNAATHNSRKLEVKRKCHHGAQFGYMQNYSALDKSVSESLDIRTKHCGAQLGISTMSSSSIDMKKIGRQQLLENAFFCSVSSESEEASQIQGKWQAQSLTSDSSVPVSGGFAVHSSGSSVANPKPVMWPHIPSFAKGTRQCTSKILLKDMFSQGKFVKRIISGEGTQIPHPSQTYNKEKSKSCAITEENKISPKEQDMDDHSPEQISANMVCMQRDSCKHRKRALELPIGENGRQPHMEKPPARSNIGQQPQKKKQPERSNIIVLALPAFQCKKT